MALARTTKSTNFWTKEEETSLLTELASTLTIEEIAERHKRTSGAIHARQNHLARRMVNEDGKSIEEAATLVRQPIHSIIQMINAAKCLAERTKVPKTHDEETMLSVMIDVRSLLRQMVNNQTRIIRDMNA